MHLPFHIQKRLDQLSELDQLRRIPSEKEGLIDFCSNDYLGIARFETEISGRIKGATGARLLRGTLKSHLELEAFAAKAFLAESALLFNSGYQANIGVLSCLAERNDTYIYDEACHASLKDGMRLSQAKRYSFRHNDLQDLERLLKQSSGNCFIVVESLYSMDGDWCKLAEIEELAKQYGAWIVLDEAHSTGIVGEGGAGFAVSLGLENAIFLRIFTFGKAIGKMGAIVVGPSVLRDFLVNRSRAWIYSTAMPGLLAESILESLQMMQQMEMDRGQLKQLRQAMNQAFSPIGFFAEGEGSPIFPLIVPGNSNAKRLAQEFEKLGFDARAILSPTVPVGAERIRIVLHSFNTEEEISRLANATKLLMKN